MTQYLVRTLTDSTGHPFTHVTKARENETFTVVEAESKEEAKTIAQEVFNGHPSNVSLPGEIIDVVIEEDE